MVMVSVVQVVARRCEREYAADFAVAGCKNANHRCHEKRRMPGRRTPLMSTLAGGRGKRNLACHYFPLAEGGHSSREPK